MHSLFAKETFSSSQGTTLPYRIYIPKSAKEPLPLLLFLHGAGERGTDNEQHLDYLLPAFAPENSPLRGAIVVAPQCPDGKQWVDKPWGSGSYTFDPENETKELSAVWELIHDLCSRFSVDRHRLYITGLSMGGFGTWELLMLHPHTFAGAVPICGGGDPTMAKALAEIPIHTFHSADDPIVPVEATREMAEAIQKQNPTDFIYTEYTDAGHAAWRPVYDDPAVMEWLFSNRRQGGPYMEKYSRFRLKTVSPIGENGQAVTACPAHIALAHEAAAESMVLLKNDRHTLPLKKGARVALFGCAAYSLITGGDGSGEVYSPYVRQIFDGLLQKEEEGKVTVDRALTPFYRDAVEKELCRLQEHNNYQSLLEDAFSNTEAPDFHQKLWNFYQNRITKEPRLTDEQIAASAREASVGIVVFSRFSREGCDRFDRPGDYYLSDEEKTLIGQVRAAFETAIVVLNVGSVIDCEELQCMDAILMAWQPGMTGGDAVADLLCGDKNPCGKLVDTIAKSYDCYPSKADFAASDTHLDYSEDIYVGYRYFETLPNAKGNVRYPFGFGLSYTEFGFSHILAEKAEDTVTFSFTVTNTGAIPGKEVAQLYLQAPQGKLGKPKKQLVAFEKTRLLAPGESQSFTFTLPVCMFASFDDLGKIKANAYVLEKGDYVFYLGNSVESAESVGVILTGHEDRIIKQVLPLCLPRKLKQRLVADGSYENLPAETAPFTYPEHAPLGGVAPKETVLFDAVGEDISMEDFIAQMTDEELCVFVGGTPSTCAADTGCFGGLERLGIPAIPTADGPAGLRIPKNKGVRTTAWPCATPLACTFNTELVKRVAMAAADEVKENRVGVWLTPAINIHRDPLCGRNFEYFSEDPLLAGKMAAAVVTGIQSRGVGASVKHFACNNKELIRHISDSRVSARALREIYLKPFEICVTEAQPLTVMTSYNLLNGLHTSENAQLITGILRGEWGFKGMVETDWAVKNDPVKEVKAGNDMKMHVGYPEDLKAALQSGDLTRADLEHCVMRILNMMLFFAN